jgi:hypothetical protein
MKFSKAARTPKSRYAVMPLELHTAVRARWCGTFFSPMGTAMMILAYLPARYSGSATA